MALPQTGFGGNAFIPRMYGMRFFKIDPTGITGHSSDATFYHSIDVGSTIARALPDILDRIGIYPSGYTTAATNKPKLKVTIAYDRDGTVNDDVTDYGKTFAEFALQEGDTIAIKDV